MENFRVGHISEEIRKSFQKRYSFSVDRPGAPKFIKCVFALLTAEQQLARTAKLERKLHVCFHLLPFLLFAVRQEGVLFVKIARCASGVHTFWMKKGIIVCSRKEEFAASPFYQACRFSLGCSPLLIFVCKH